MLVLFLSFLKDRWIEIEPGLTIELNELPTMWKVSGIRETKRTY